MTFWFNRVPIGPRSGVSASGSTVALQSLVAQCPSPRGPMGTGLGDVGKNDALPDL